MVAILFWLILALIVYTYAGYPFLLSVAARIRPRKFQRQDILPSVSIIIAAYNEEKSIEKKLLNCLELDYPKEKMEIIVASDFSTDKTHEIVNRFENKNIRLLIGQERKGKTAGRNRTVPLAQGEIIVLSDATGMYHPDALKKLVRHFADRRVGCVAGILRYVNPTDSMVGSGEGLYWRYEVLLRTKESMLGNLIAVSGSIYAFRKELFRHIPEALADDLIMPLMIRKLGFNSVYEPEAVCIEEASKSNQEESAKRVRIAIRNIMGLLYMKELLNVFKYGLFSIELFSHKILRLMIPIFLMALFFLNISIARISAFYSLFLLAQVSFYVLAFLGNILQGKHKKTNNLLYIPLFFCLTNLSIMQGIVKYFFGHRKAVWEPSR